MECRNLTYGASAVGMRKEAVINVGEGEFNEEGMIFNGVNRVILGIGIGRTNTTIRFNGNSMISAMISTNGDLEVKKMIITDWNYLYLFGSIFCNVGNGRMSICECLIYGKGEERGDGGEGGERGEGGESGGGSGSGEMLLLQGNIFDIGGGMNEIRNVSFKMMRHEKNSLIFGNDFISLSISGCDFSNISLERGNGSCVNVIVKEKSILSISKCLFNYCNIISDGYGGGIYIYISDCYGNDDCVRMPFIFKGNISFVECESYIGNNVFIDGYELESLMRMKSFGWLYLYGDEMNYCGYDRRNEEVLAMWRYVEKKVVFVSGEGKDGELCGRFVFPVFNDWRRI
jgi:hypothetical protein